MRGDKEEGLARRRIMVLEGLAQAGGGSAPGRGCPSHSSHVGEEWPDSNAPICQWWGGQQGEGMTSTGTQCGAEGMAAESFQSTVPHGRFC